MTSRTICLAMTVGCLLLALGVSVRPLAAQNVPLAEVARKEQERRKKVAEPVRVITNQELKRLPAGWEPPPTPPPPKPAAAAGGTTPPASERSKADVEKEEKDESYWRARIGLLRQQLDRNKVFVDALQSRINALASDFVNRDDPAQRALIGEDRQRAMAELERVKLEIERLTTDIAAVEDEARREGVPPGWLR